MTSPHVVSLPTHPTRCVDPAALHAVAQILDDGSVNPVTALRAARVGVHAMHYGERVHGCETAMQAWRRMRRDPDIAAVLEYVRETGRAAIWTSYSVSVPVEAVAVDRAHAADLQRRVNLYSLTFNAAARAASVVR